MGSVETSGPSSPSGVCMGHPVPWAQGPVGDCLLREAVIWAEEGVKRSANGHWAPERQGDHTQRL